MGMAGILRPDEVVFYHPLDNLTEHTQSQAWTGTGGFVLGKIGSATSAITGDSLAYGSLNTHDTGIKEHAMEALDSSRVLMAYKAGTGAVRVGTVSGTEITWGAPAAGSSTSSNGYQMGLAMLDSTRFVLGHRTGSGQMVRTGTVSGTDVTLGPEHAFTAAIARGCRLAKIDSNRALLAYSAYDAAAENGNVRVVTVSGTDVTFGPANNFDTSLREESIGLARIDSARILISWVTDPSPYNGYVAVVTVSGADATFAPKKEFDGALGAIGRTVARSMGSGKCVIVWQSGSDGNSGRSKIITVSGTDITFGPEAMVMPQGFIGEATALSSTQFVVAFWAVAFASRAPAYVVGTVSGVSITYGGYSTPHIGTGSGDDTESFAVAGLDSQTMVGVASRAADSETAAGVLGVSADISAPTPGAYPSVVGATRVAVAMWAQNVAAGSSQVSVERGCFSRYDCFESYLDLDVSFGPASVDWKLSGVGTAVNDGSPHLLVFDFEHEGGGVWRLRSSVDGAPFVDRGTGTGTQSVPATDTAPRLSIADGESGQWIDELVMWAGDKSTFDAFTSEELANLYDLAESFDEGMEQYEQNYGAPICWQATAVMPDGTVWRDSGSGPCPPVVRVPRGASGILVTDNGRQVSPHIVEG